MLVVGIVSAGTLTSSAEEKVFPAAEPHAAEQFGPQHMDILSSEGSTRGTAYIESNKILTIDGKMHVTWLDGGLGGSEPVRIRTLDLKGGKWSPIYTLGKAYDNHANPTIANDSQGYLHAIFDGHNRPLTYRRSLRPNDASEWTDPQSIGKRATYASLICDANDTLHLVCRDRVAQELQLVYYRRKADGKWSERRALVESTVKDNEYRCYRASLFPDRQQRLHLGFMLFPGDAFENARSQGAIGYLCSDNYGDTWSRSDGMVVNTPTSTDFERIPAVENCYRVSNLVADLEGTPYIACVSTGREPYPDKWGEATLWKRDASEWRSTPLVPYIQKVYPEHRASRVEPSLAFDEAGNLYIALVAVDEKLIDPRSKWINEPGSIYGHSSSKIVMLVSTDRGQTFEYLPMKAFGSLDTSWLPSLERFTGHNRVTVPRLIYTRGIPGKGTKPKDAVSEILMYSFTRKE